MQVLILPTLRGRVVRVRARGCGETFKLSPYPIQTVQALVSARDVSRGAEDATLIGAASIIASRKPGNDRRGADASAVATHPGKLFFMGRLRDELPNPEEFDPGTIIQIRSQSSNNIRQMSPLWRAGLSDHRNNNFAHCLDRA